MFKIKIQKQIDLNKKPIWPKRGLHRFMNVVIGQFMVGSSKWEQWIKYSSIKPIMWLQLFFKKSS